MLRTRLQNGFGECLGTDLATSRYGRAQESELSKVYIARADVRVAGEARSDPFVLWLCFTHRLRPAAASLSRESWPSVISPMCLLPNREGL